MRLRDAEEIEYIMDEDVKPDAEKVIENTKLRVHSIFPPEPEKLNVKMGEDLKDTRMIVLEIYPPERNPLEEIYAEDLNSGEEFEAKRGEYVRFDEEIEDIFSCLKVYWNPE